MACTHEPEQPGVFSTRDTAQAIIDCIGEHLIHADVDQPAGCDAGYRIMYDEKSALEEIEAILKR